MDIETFLRIHDADLVQVVDGVRAITPLESGDRLLAVGSLAEGLGNRKSDVDLILVTPGIQHAGASPDEVQSFVAGRCIVDLRIAPTDPLDALCSRLRQWAMGPWEVSLPASFSANELLLLHRLGAGRQLWPETDPNAAGTLVLCEDVARLKLHVARHMARTLQVDMTGYREEGDNMSLVFSAQDLLGHAVDGLLAGYRLTNPTPKWRRRLLDLLPADWESRLVMRPCGLTPSELMWRLHRTPAEASGPAALEYACKIATFARSVFLWAEETLIHGGREVARRYEWSEPSAPRAAPALPFLDIDVDFMRTESGIAVGRLNDLGDTLHLSFGEFALMMLFDNVTTAQEAARMTEAEPQTVPVESVEQFAAELRRTGFSLPA